MKDNRSKRKKITPLFYMNTIYFFQQYPLKPNSVISSKILRFLAHLYNRPPNSISFFTDGSKDEASGRVAAACYWPDLNSFSLLVLHNYFSIFSAECIALNNAIKMAPESSSNNVFIYSGNLSTLQALIKSSVTITTNSFILDIRRLINRYSSGNKKLYFYWIPSHLVLLLTKKRTV